jgi:hypothetical protein
VISFVADAGSAARATDGGASGNVATAVEGTGTGSNRAVGCEAQPATIMVMAKRETTGNCTY